MVEIPENLRKRTEERKRALGLTSGDAPTESGDTAAASAGTPAAAPVAAGNSPVPGVAIATSAPVPPRYVGPPQQPPIRHRIPFYVIPVLFFLPVWALLYYGSLQVAPKLASDPISQGSFVFHNPPANCAGCHGQAGDGTSSGPKLAGTATTVWKTDADQIEWVTLGSAKWFAKYPKQKTFGSIGCASCQQPDFGAAMPAWGGTLTPTQIADVVAYERSLK